MSYTTTKAPGKTVLRSNFGSHPEVVRVFSYNPGRGTACVLFKTDDGTTNGGQDHDCVSESDLEAFDGHMKYTSVAAELRKRAEHKIN